MFHKAIKLELKEGTSFELTFQNGEVKSYDIAVLYPKYPQLRALEDRSLFLQGSLMGSSGVVWNDDLDIDAETVYEDGELVRTEEVPVRQGLGASLAQARASRKMTQKDLADACGIDQSDISKIERGVANPSVSTLERLANALELKLVIKIQ